MMNFKRCGTVAALLLATAVPAIAQEAETITIPEGFVAPEGSILLTFQDDDELYVVPYEVAAEFCDISTIDLTTLAQDPQTEVIYCEDLDDARFEELVTAGSITPMSNLEDSGDDDDDDGDFSDDAEEAAEEEAIEDQDDDDGILDEDDVDQEEEGLDDVDDGADTDVDVEDGSDDTDTDTDTDTDVDADVDADADTDSDDTN